MTKQRDLEADLSSIIEKMLPLFDMASKVAHKLEKAAAEDDPEQAHYDRLVDLGMLTDCAHIYVLRIYKF